MPIVKQPLPTFAGTISQPDPNWITPTGIVSSGNETLSITVPLQATDPFNGNIVYSLKSGQLPGFHNSFGNMAVLLHADEPEASPVTVNAVTSTGILLENTMVITNTESKFGIGSIDNQNKEGYINFGKPSTLGLSNNDFSIHGWFNRKANPVAIYELFSNNQLPSNVVSIRVYLNNTSVPVYTIVTSNMTNYELVGLQPVLLNTWTHIAMVKRNATMYAFVDGILQGSVIMDSLLLRFDADNDLFLCASGELGETVGSLNYNRFNGRIDEFVIELGARWTSTFIPPVIQFDPIPLSLSSIDPFISNVKLSLSMEGTPNTPTFIDDSILSLVPDIGLTAHINSTVFKYGASSMEVLNDLNSSIIYTHNDLNSVTATTITLEAWIYIKSWADWRTVFDGSGTTVYVNAQGNYRWWWGYSVIETTNSPVTLNTWHHIAIVKESAYVIKFYHNGIQILSSNVSAINAYTLEIGSAVNRALYPWDGYIDDVRVTRNVARYITNFIPPGSISTTPVLPSVPGVTLGIDGILNGNVGPYLGVSGSDLYNFTATATSDLTRISSDRNFNITVFDPNLNTNWVSTWNGNAVQHTITNPNTAQFNASTPNNVWLIWNNP